MCGVGRRKLQKVDPQCLVSYEILRWRTAQKICWTDHVRNEKKKSVTKNPGREEYSTSNKREEGNWIGQILRRNCLLKHVVEGNIEGRI